MREKKILKFLSALKGLIFILIIVLIVNMYFFSLSAVRQNSMENTLKDRDIIVLNKFYSDYDYGDVVVFVEGANLSGFYNKLKLLRDDFIAKFIRKDINFRMVKRIVAKDGDEVVIKDGEVFVNKVKINEPYLNQMTAKGDIKYPYIVPRDMVFVLGDNREVSNDSRSFGAVPISSIEGKVLFRLLPIGSFGSIKQVK